MAVSEQLGQNSGKQAIHHAAATNAEILFLLIARGADVDALANDGDRPLHFAALHGKTANIDLLLAAGANAQARNVFGATPAEVNEDAATRNAFANGPSEEAIEKIRTIFPSPHEETNRRLRKYRGQRPPPRAVIVQEAHAGAIVVRT